MQFIKTKYGHLRNEANTVLKFDSVEQMKENIKKSYQDASCVTVEKVLEDDIIYLESIDGYKSYFRMDLYNIAKEHSNLLRLSVDPKSGGLCGGILFSENGIIIAVAPLDFVSTHPYYSECSLIPENV
jgi:hypothetical protein